MSRPQDEVQKALAAFHEADLKVRASVKAVVTGQAPRDPVHFRQLVAERSAAFATFLQAFIRRSREKATLADATGAGPGNVARPNRKL